MGAGGPSEGEDAAHGDGLGPLPAMALVRVAATVLLTCLALVQEGADRTAILVVLAVAVVHLAWSTPALLRGPSPAALLGARVLDLSLVAVTVPFCGDGAAIYGIAAIVAAFSSAPLVPHGDRASVRVGFTIAVSGTLAVTELARGDWRSVASYVVASTLLALIAATVARVQEARRQRLRAVADERRELLGDSAELAEADRRALSQALHDRVLQNLLAAGQDLDEAMDDRDEAHADDVRHARDLLRASVVALRDTVSQMHPAALAGERLPSALRALLEAHGDDADLEIDADIDETATGPHDAELLAVARELVANAASRPGPGTIRVRLWCEGGRCLLDVQRIGLDARPGQREGDTAIATVGIAWTAERLRRVGGGIQLELGPEAPGRGHAWAPLVVPATSDPVPAAAARAAGT